MRILSITILLISLSLTSCHFGHDRIKGDGQIKTEARTVSNFSKVDVSGNFDVYLKQDSLTSVRVEADQNLMKYIKVHESNGTVYIETENDVELDGSKPVKIYVASPSFQGIDASGSCEIRSENKLSDSSRIEISLSGSSDVDLEVNSPVVRSHLSGSGAVKLKGQTKDLSLSGSGSFSAHTMDLLAENVGVEISGSGSADVFASVKLDVSVSGSGDVRYKGNASVSQHISGSGSVTKQQ